MLQKPKDDV